MSWESIVEWVKDFFNQPVPIIGVSVGLLLLYSLVIFSKTSLGKKALNTLRTKCEEAKKETETIKKEVDEFKERIIKETSEQVSSMKEYYETELKKGEAKIAVLEKLCISMAELSHNGKIESVVEETKDKLVSCKTDFDFMVEEKVEQTKATYEEKYETEMKHYKEEVDKVIDEVKKMAEMTENKAKTISADVDEALETAKTEIIETKNSVETEIKEAVEELVDEVKVNE